jgi:RNA polymerase sigma-70 factor (ECF subfamily)
MDVESLFDEYYDKVYVYIARRVNSSADAEDLTADVFFKIFSNPHDPKLLKVSSYIFTVASNTLKNHYRSAARKNLFFINGETDENFPDKMDILGELITDEEYNELKKALASLPEREYEVVYRRYYLGESFKQIGDTAGISEVYARKIHERALKTLKKFLK